MSKFKVGDKVRVRSWESMEKEFGTYPSGSIRTKYTFIEEMRKYCGKIVTIAYLTGCGYGIKEDRSGHVYSDDMFENPSYAVIIYSEDNKVIAFDKATGRKAEAICSPKDEFDFYFGADLAFERLMNGDAPKEKEKEKVKYYTGEIFCTDSTTPFFTKGKIYKVNDGLVHDNSGTIYISKKAKSFGEIFSTIKRATFIEVKK